MFITRTITKKILENIIHQTFCNFGNISSSSLLDSLKFLGFYYATNAGVSISIEDLKTPSIKQKYLSVAETEMKMVSEQWEQGFVSDTERFQSIIDSWNVATESLKNRVVDYYQTYDPVNNLYIMAFSGARGNMSQVRQLVGMRGLMSDQEGKIIDLPIQTNFREGLSSIDYIISSYGARKGIVDTALKTADSGYLTRRLIYIAQDLVIREFNCNTDNGILVFLNTKTNFKNILGRVLISSSELKNNQDLTNIKIFNQKNSNLILDEKILKNLKSENTKILKIRSPLTCKSNGSICQNCYGWDLAQQKLISLGEAVGIIAAQSIGEPGTQLTMRTFHTGGIFTSEMLKQTLSPFSGKIIIPDSLKTISYRTNHGINVLRLLQEANLIIYDWKGLKKNIFLEIGSFLYISNSTFVKKGQLISEYSDLSSIPGARRLKPIYTSLDGEIKFESLLVRYIFREEKPRVKVNQDNGILWLASGKIFGLPSEIKYINKNFLNKNYSFSHLKIVIPFNGIINIEKNFITILNDQKQIKLNLENLIKKFKNCNLKFALNVKNYQYIDKYTVIGFIYFLPDILKESDQFLKIYSIRQKDSKNIKILFFITEKDVWKINSDQITNLPVFQPNKGIARSGTLINKTLKLTKSGFFLKKDGLKLIFQEAKPIFLSRGTILNYKQGDFVFKNKVLATLVNYTQQTEDIVQGLPKIEELIEARIPKLKSYLSIRPGIFLNSLKFQNFLGSKIENNILNCIYDSDSLNINDNSSSTLKSIEKQKELNLSTLVNSKKKKQIIQIIHSLYTKEDIIIFNDKIWRSIPIPPNFLPYAKKTKQKGIKVFGFKKSKKQTLIINKNGKNLSSTWFQYNVKENNLFLYKYEDNKIVKWKKLDENELIYKNSKEEDYIVKIENNKYYYLENLNPVLQYKLPLSTKLIFKPGYFIDIGEPITEGVIDPHELLSIFFKYHSVIDGTFFGTLKSLNKFQLLLVNSVQGIYESQGVNISSKHVEIIVRQMTAKVVIKESGDTPLLTGELIRLSFITEIYKALKQNFKTYKTPKYEPLFLSTTNSSLSKDGFLSTAGFQETKRVLTKATIEGTTDWLRGLKECVIIGRLIPAGSAFLNYKNYLDNIYLFKQ